MEVDSTQVRQQLRVCGVSPQVLEQVDDRQATTLAQMMVADDAVTDAFLNNPALTFSNVPLGDILDDVGALMQAEVGQWINFFSPKSLLKNRARRVRTTADALHCATLIAAEMPALAGNMILAEMLPTEFERYPLREKLMKRFAPSFRNSKTRFGNQTAVLRASVVIPGEVVINTVRLSHPPNDIAFASFGKTDRTAARETLLGHKMMALALSPAVQAPHVDLILYGGNRINRAWREEMAGVAHKLDLTFRVRPVAGRFAPISPMML